MALPSFMSVHIRSERTLLGADERDVCVIAGTGFVVQHDAQTFLITNGHIVTGRHRTTDEYLGLPALPQRLVVTVPMAGEGLGGDGVALLGTTQLVVDLYDENDRALWLAHPHFGRRFDVVAIQLELPATNPGSQTRTELLPYSLGPLDPINTLVTAQDLSVVGFPFGLRGGADSAIWVRGTVASEPGFGFEGEPCFLIDARTRHGQSGSPVIVPVRRHEQSELGGGMPWRIVGIYSGRTDEASDLGRVWHLSVLNSILTERKRDSLQLI